MISNPIKNKNNIYILSTYIQSVGPIYDEVNIFIEHLRTLNFEFSAICTQESCISDNEDMANWIETCKAIK